MKPTEVLVLGHRGMLGQVVSRWLRQNGFVVRTTDARFRGGPEDELIAEVIAARGAAVVNCIGQLPSREGADRAAASDLFLANALLPQRLAVAMGPERTLVHASSDGVFDGERGSYAVDDAPNASDPYGVSKQLGELARYCGGVVVLRCSILGLEVGTSRGLLSWFLAQKGPVSGYTNHHWNGISTLEWARLAMRALCHDPALAAGVHQPACAPSVSKYHLLATAAGVFDHHIEITPRQAERSVDRTLKATIVCPSLVDQLQELRAWHRSGPGATDLGAPAA